MESVGVQESSSQNPDVANKGDKETKFVYPDSFYPKFLNEIKDQDVVLFFKYYISGVEINESLLDSFTSFIINEENSPLVEQILHSNLLKHYPTSKSNRIQVLKRIIARLSFQSIFNDTLFEALSNAIITKNDGGYSYRSFIDMKKGGVIVVRKMDALVTFGTTGMTCWRASAVLAEYISRFCDFDDKNLLELGAGCGLSGIAAAKYHNVKNLYFTDRSEQVLEQLNENIRINFPEESRNITIQKLDWDHFNEEELLVSPDIILGADLLYNENSFPGLCSALKKLLTKHDSYAIFAHNIRNRCTLETFFDVELARHNLKPKRICQALLPKDEKGIDFF
uniref:FAM86 N-terminal domain-containing protein n=1 Tax=Acrobeloides nanus TaxID=290746 RepID=A0A914C782_9BILA